MKKLFLQLAFLIISTTGYSQIKIRPGLRASLNFSNLINSGFDDIVLNQLFQIGVTYKFDF
jgi:hypothetical protein